MSQSVNLPALGESVTEGTVTRWLKNVGDRVEVDEPLVEVSTDKVDTEIPSPIAGVIEAILVQEDETVEVGTALATVGDGSDSAEPATDAPAQAEPEAAEEPVSAPEAEQAPVAEVPSTEAPAPAEAAPAEAPEAPTPPAQVDEAPAEAAPEPAATPAAPPAPAVAPAAPTVSAPPAVHQAPAVSTGAGAGYVTPLVRRMANEHGVDLSTLTGTGVGGRIRKQDVEAAVADSSATSPASAREPLEVSELRGTTVPMSRLRKVVAERAVASMQGTAQLTSVVEVDVTRVAAMRTARKDEFLKTTGEKLTFLPFFAKATVEALQAYPIVNATVDGDSIVYPAQENLSIAVDTERGLLTPVVKGAADLTIADLAQQIADLANRTRNNQLKPDELAGGTFTLTNTGSRGALFDTPVVFLPQSAILGTGIVTKRPVVISGPDGDSIAIRSMVYLALSYDHRIVDGADASRFLVAIKQRLEEGDFSGDLGL